MLSILIVTQLTIGIFSRLGETALTISNSSSISAISNYNTDFATCICDLNSGYCDIFCCCDTQCNTASIAKWTTSAVCLPSSTYESHEDIETEVTINGCQNMSLFSL
jgi:hypothetical protein